MNREKILIFGPSWVGDMMMAKSLFSNLKKRNPKCIIHLAAPRWSIDIANRFSEIDKTIPLDFSHGKLDLIKRVRLSLSLRKEKYDECIFLVNTFKSLFSILFANIKLRTGYIGERRGLFLNNAFQNNVLPTIEKFTALSRSKSYKPKIISPSIEFDKTRGIKFLSKRKIPHHKLVVIAGGAEYGPAKILPQQKYAHIAIK
ncbi:MAG: lipopolysaccharide heptosyltransferase II, partial [Methylophilaceae bacterium]